MDQGEGTSNWMPKYSIARAASRFLVVAVATAAVKP